MGVRIANILDKAIALLRTGVPWDTAIEIACKRSRASEVQQERARALFVRLLARAEREAAAAREAA